MAAQQVPAQESKEQTADTCDNTGDSQKCYVEWKKLEAKKYILCHLIHMKFQNK